MIDPDTHPAYFSIRFTGQDGEDFCTSSVTPPPEVGVIQMRALVDQAVGVLNLKYDRMTNGELAAIINCCASIFFARGGHTLVVAGEDAPPGVGAADHWTWHSDRTWPPALAGADGDRGGPRFARGYWSIRSGDLAVA